MSCFADGVIYQLPTQTFALPRGVNGNVVDEVRVSFGPGNHIAGDHAAALDHHNMVGRDLRCKIGYHRCRLAPYAGYVLGVSSASDCANASSIACRSPADHARIVQARHRISPPVRQDFR